MTDGGWLFTPALQYYVAQRTPGPLSCSPADGDDLGDLKPVFLKPVLLCEYAGARRLVGLEEGAHPVELATGVPPLSHRAEYQSQALIQPPPEYDTKHSM